MGPKNKNKIFKLPLFKILETRRIGVALRKLAIVTVWKSGLNMLKFNTDRKANGEIQVTGKPDV